MKRKFFFNDFDNEDEDNFTWPNKKRTKKSEEQPEKYMNGFFSTSDVRCVGNIYKR